MSRMRSLQEFLVLDFYFCLWCIGDHHPTVECVSCPLILSQPFPTSSPASPLKRGTDPRLEELQPLIYDANYIMSRFDSWAHSSTSLPHGHQAQL